jgi:hypothetical protein
MTDIIPVPDLDPDTDKLPPIPRVAKILKYRLLQLEYWVSPNGALRTWLKFCIRLCLVIAIGAFLIVPVLALALHGIAAMVTVLVGIAWHILELVLLVIGILIAVYVLRAFFTHRSNRSHNRRSY